MSYTVSTREARVIYGRAYLDESQAAAQDAVTQAVASGQTLYGAAYREPVPVDVPAPIATLPVRELTAALAAATEAVVLEHLAREVHRQPAPRKSAIEVLQAAATRLGMTEKAAQLAQMLTELTGE